MTVSFSVSDVFAYICFRKLTHYLQLGRLCLLSLDASEPSIMHLAYSHSKESALQIDAVIYCLPIPVALRSKA